jgi:hypothetical protein
LHSAYNSCISLNFFIDEPQQGDGVAGDDAQLPHKVQLPKKVEASPIQAVSPVADASAPWRGYAHQHPKCQHLDASCCAFCSSRLTPVASTAATLLRGYSIIKGRHKTKGDVSRQPPPPPLNRAQAPRAASLFLRMR